MRQNLAQFLLTKNACNKIKDDWLKITCNKQAREI